MKLRLFAYASYAFYSVAHMCFLYVAYTYYEGGREYQLAHLPGDIGSIVLPLIFAGAAALMVRLFKHPAYLKVFHWVLICFSILIGLFSLFAAYLSWWSLSH